MNEKKHDSVAEDSNWNDLLEEAVEFGVDVVSEVVDFGEVFSHIDF
jgi:hypothetical protein